MPEAAKTVLITGCSSGIGHATALHLNGRGWTVYASARRPESIGDLAEAGCHPLALDVTDEASMQAAVNEVTTGGPLGALVNNAGYSQSGAVETLPMEKVRAQFETNVFGLVRMCQLVLPGMRAAGKGRIVNVSSMGGKLVFPGGGAYHATKFAVEAFSDALRWEVRGFGVDVVVIEPGLITTRFGETAAGSISATDGEATEGGEDPYARFNAAVGAATAAVYEGGPLSKLGGGPETVARAIERAISARRPKTRYKVTASARLALAQRRLVTDRVWDAMMRTQFRAPGPG
jgi:NAD(P)-dependent dehydrogenase (short-subunit alcohol dehydrogenase family)